MRIFRGELAFGADRDQAKHPERLKPNARREAPEAKNGGLSARPMIRRRALEMIERRAQAAGIKTQIGCHTFRATGITIYLTNGGTLEKAQMMAAHSSPRTTKLYDRTKERLTQDEVERIRL